MKPGSRVTLREHFYDCWTDRLFYKGESFEVDWLDGEDVFLKIPNPSTDIVRVSVLQSIVYGRD